MPTFGLVQQLQHIRIKKLFAGFLFCLLLFVYAEKAFHHHERNDSEINKTGFAQFSNKSGCSICDFKLTKEIETPAPLFEDGILLVSSFNFELSDIAIYCINNSAQKDRGPPQS